MIRRPPRSTLDRSSAASDVYKRQIQARGVEPDVLVEAAYVADKTFGVIRESDLENHLPAEGAPGSGSRPVDAGAVPTDAGAGEAGAGTHLGVSRDIPSDPTGGSDLALSIGYQLSLIPISEPTRPY